jgi:hypothetical protein
MFVLRQSSFYRGARNECGSILLVSSWWWSHPLDIQHVVPKIPPIKKGMSSLRSVSPCSRRPPRATTAELFRLVSPLPFPSLPRIPTSGARASERDRPYRTVDPDGLSPPHPPQGHHPRWQRVSAMDLSLPPFSAEHHFLSFFADFSPLFSCDLGLGRPPWWTSILRFVCRCDNCVKLAV